MRFWCIGFIFIFFWASNLWATVDLFEWRPEPSSTWLLLPKHERESYDEAVNRYRQYLSSQSPLAQIVGPTLPPGGETRALMKGRDKSLFVANRAGDHELQNSRAQRFMSHFQKNRNYLLPLGALERFHRNDRTELLKKITEEFSGLIVMGGDDLDPKTYQEPVKGAIDFNPKRDALEIELVQTWIRANRGFLFGVCRGHQLTAVSMGFKLIQHIPAEVSNALAHGDNNHWVVVNQTQNQILQNSVSGRISFPVYSWHHQSVLEQWHPDVEVAARSQDGVVEALEDRQGRFLTVQFHPELNTKENSASRAILKTVENRIQTRVGRFSCQRLFLH